MHIIHLCHVRLDKVRGVEKASPAYQPKVGQAIQRDLKMIGYCSVGRDGDEPVRLVQVVDDQFATAKTRIQYNGKELPPVIKQADVVKAIAARYSTSIIDIAIDNQPVEVEA